MYGKKRGLVVLYYWRGVTGQVCELRLGRGMDLADQGFVSRRYPYRGRVASRRG